MRSILVFADRSVGMTNRLETALSLARATNGHVSLLIDTPIARYMAMDAMGGSYLAADAMREAVARDDAYAAELTTHLSREDVPFDIQRCESEPVDALTDASRLADVVILSRKCEFAGQLAVSAAAPVLLVPEGERLDCPVERIAIGWDGGYEAAAALRAAVPLLTLSSEVHLLTVKEKAGGFPATEALRYLSRHGVKAELSELSRAGSTEETLAGAVMRLQAGLLVMGAYGHSRLREFLFGGVTDYFIGVAGGPALLLAH